MFTPETINRIQPYEYIRAPWLNAVRDAAYRADTLGAQGGRRGVRFDSFTSISGIPGTIIRVAQMLLDAVSYQWVDSGPTNDTTFSNATLLAYDDLFGTWTEEGGYANITVRPTSLPLKAGDILPVWLHPSGYWLPVNERETEFVRITSLTPTAVTTIGGNTVNLFPGFIQMWNNDTLSFSDGNPCWVIDTNA